MGTMNGVNVYADNTGVSSYNVLNGFLYSDSLWAAFSGGDLNGLSPTPGIGFKDFAGNTEMNDLYILNVESNGTLGYYEWLTGNYAAYLDPTYGSWTTLSDGPLSGLTLTQLASTPVGSANGNAYRFLGTYNDGLVFEVPSVPEPSSALLALSAGVAMITRRRKTATA